MEGIPKIIYLQIGEFTKTEIELLDFETVRREGAVTWSCERVYESDIPYELK